MKKFNLPKNALLFAPMEGITDNFYRNVIHKLYPEWDKYACDFLRVPSTNPYPRSHIIKHYGREVLDSSIFKAKTIYQILTSPGAYTEETVRQINELEVPWIDLNLGCPSKTVCKNKGGSYLLDHHEELRIILKSIRENFDGIFSCKIRVGYEDDKKFISTLKLIEDAGAQTIMIHGRTRNELYKGTANWDYIKNAVKAVSIPIVGNGDIWSKEDVERYFDYTGCHSIMLARSALKTPYLARLVKSNESDSKELRHQEIKKYFSTFYEETLKQKLPESSRIKRLKSVSRYIFDDLPQGDKIKRSFLLSKSFEEQMQVLGKI